MRIETLRGTRYIKKGGKKMKGTEKQTQWARKILETYEKSLKKFEQIKLQSDLREGEILDLQRIDKYVEENKVIVAFRGMCAQCRLAEFTMKDVVEAKLREFVSDELFVEEDKESAQQPHNHRE